MTLAIGAQAPDFDVRAADGRALKLADFRGQKNVVLYFYPKDFTRGCTAEACGFRDLTADANLGGDSTQVIGVSLDSDDSHLKFAQRHNLNFPLVADQDRSLAKKYEAIGALGGMLGITKRVTYVIDKQGKIVGVFDSFFDADDHLDGVRGVLKGL